MRFPVLTHLFRLADLAEAFGDSVNSPSALAYSFGAASIGMGLYWLWSKTEGKINPLVDLNAQTRALNVSSNQYL
jgi:hypothetical protein